MNQVLSFIFEYVFDILFAIIAQIPWVSLKYFAKPYHRGFFCNDQTLMYPYKNSTVTNAMLTAINMTFPIVTIFIIELKISGALQKFFSIKDNETNKLMFLKFTFKTLCIFFVGFGINQSTTNVLKWTIGRLRPHFFSVCVPSYKAPCNAHLYIQNAECVGTNFARIKDSRLSFPSGHASSSMYTMLFTAIYVHYRSKRCRLQTFKAFYEGMLIMLALWIGASRVSDYKHHWSDVVIGTLIGTIFGILFGSCAVYGMSPFWKKYYCAPNASSPNRQKDVDYENAYKSPSTGNVAGYRDGNNYVTDTNGPSQLAPNQKVVTESFHQTTSYNYNNPQDRRVNPPLNNNYQPAPPIKRYNTPV